MLRFLKIRGSSLPRKPRDAIVLAKHNFGWTTPEEGNFTYGVSFFANRAGYAYLAKFFDFMVQKEMRKQLDPDTLDPGNHEHLKLDDLGDQIQMTFDVVTDANQDTLFSNANISRESRLSGSAMKQFARFFDQGIKWLDREFPDDAPIRKIASVEIEELIARMVDAKKRLLPKTPSTN